MMLTESALCERFLYNQTINPETNRPIKRDSKTFLELNEKCSKYIKPYDDIYTVPENTLIKEYCSGIHGSSSADELKRVKERVKTLMKKKFKKIYDQQNLGRVSFDPKGSRYCHEFVPADLEMECSSGRRTIVVLDFIKRGEKPLIQDYKFCDVSYGDSIKYYIKYVPIPYDTFVAPIPDFSSLVPILNSNCNAMIIHLDIRYGNSDDKVQLEIANKIINKYFTYFEIPKTLYFFSNETALNALSFPDIFELRVLNVQSKYKKNYKIRYTEKDVDYLPYYALDKNDNETTLLSNSDRLSCQWWFKRFFSTVFECGKGRLVQFAGTCYLTSVFNMFTLGEYVKRIIISSMNSSVDQGFLNDDDLLYIREPIEYGMCVNLKKITLPKERIRYYCRIFYNTICKTTHMARIDPLNKDLFKTVSDSYFSSERQIDTKEGGWARSVLFKLLRDFGVKFLVADRDFNLYDPYSFESENAYNLMRQGFTKDALHLLDKIHDHASLKSQDPDTYPDIILYVSRGDGINRYLPISVVSPAKDLNFVPETSEIGLNLTVTFTKDGVVKKRPGGHAICGFMCDGYYKLYDSAHNMIDNWDWTQDDLMNSNYREKINSDGSWQVDNMYIGSCIFVNYNRRLKYFNEGSRCLL